MLLPALMHPISPSIPSSMLPAASTVVDRRGVLRRGREGCGTPARPHGSTRRRWAHGKGCFLSSPAGFHRPYPPCIPPSLPPSLSPSLLHGGARVFRPVLFRAFGGYSRPSRTIQRGLVRGKHGSRRLPIPIRSGSVLAGPGKWREEKEGRGEEEVRR